MAEPFITLQPTADDHRWRMQLKPDYCVGPPDRMFMFGGVGLGSAMTALEKTCGRRVIWAAAQYLSYARPDSVIELTVEELTRGHQNTQARVTTKVANQEILVVNAALGSRPSEVTRQWPVKPEAAPPETCRSALRRFHVPMGLHAQLDTLVAAAPDGSTAHETESGRIRMWMRPKHGHAIDAAMLAIMADFVPMGIGRAMRGPYGGNSLDNTIRIIRVVPTDWVLCDLQANAVYDGFGHGSMQLFADDGTLMATAGQSMILRTFDPTPKPATT